MCQNTAVRLFNWSWKKLNILNAEQPTVQLFGWIESGWFSAGSRGCSQQMLLFYVVLLYVIVVRTGSCWIINFWWSCSLCLLLPRGIKPLPSPNEMLVFISLENLFSLLTLTWNMHTELYWSKKWNIINAYFPMIVWSWTVSVTYCWVG